MDDRKVEPLLERIAVALERMCSLLEDRTLRQPMGSADPSVSGGWDVLTPRPQDSETESPKPASRVLEAFLNSKRITIKTIPQEDKADDIIDSLSLFLGERYNGLSDLLAKIKRAMQTGRPITVSLKGRSQEDVSSACQFCTRLHNIAFLEQYKYFRSPTYLIKAKTTTLPRAQRFFAGQWLERFVLNKVREIHAQVTAEVEGELPLEYLINPQIILPNGDDFELDLLVALGGAIYWIEAKSGDYQQHVAKYSKFARVLGLDYSHSLMVLTDVPDERCDALSSLFSMTVCNLKTFEDTLLAVARHDTAQQSAAADGLSPAAEP